jgi:TonB family protein
MTFDPATLCARTTAGEAETASATHGLSSGQRRVRSPVEDPTAFDDLAAIKRSQAGDSPAAPVAQPLGAALPPTGAMPPPQTVGDTVPATQSTPSPAPLPATASVPSAGSADSHPPVILAAVTAASPPPAGSAIATELKAIQSELPVFPREAIAAGIASGSVKARLHVDAGGNVMGVDLLSAQPQRIFDRTVRGALQRWQCEPGTASRTKDVAFQRN